MNSFFSHRQATRLGLPALLLAACLFAGSKKASASGSTFFVTTTADSNDGSCAATCSLRDAITASDEVSAGTNYIGFAIPGSGVQTITPATALPAITQAVMIDGYSQAGASSNTLAVGDNAVLNIELSGIFGGFLLKQGSGITIDGIVFGAPVSINSPGGDTIEGCFFGTDATGASVQGNGSGIGIGRCDGNTIGGTTPAARNLIDGSQSSGVGIVGTNNVVEGNYIGVDATGKVALGNEVGVAVSGPNNTIGGTAAGSGNVISGNTEYGVECTGLGFNPTGNVIEGNFIGTDAMGTHALGNVNGVSLDNSASNNTIGGTAAGAGNVISGNTQDGVIISAPNNTIQGNFIGTDKTGTLAVSNGLNGIDVTNANAGGIVVGAVNIGGEVSAARNVISGNANAGVYTFQVRGATINGNDIGVNVTGTAAIPNGDGVQESSSIGVTVGGFTSADRNIISGNSDAGVSAVASDGLNVDSNYIGTNFAGTSALPNGEGVMVGGGTTNATIGGQMNAGGNLISGNFNYGIILTGTSTSNIFVQGNLIGTTATGNNALPGTPSTALGGILLSLGASNNTIGDAASGLDENVIAGNIGSGINITDSGTSGNLVQDNHIGVGKSPTAAVPNSIGVSIGNGATNNTIGGISTLQGNIIADNNGKGVVLQDAGTTGNLIRCNSIFGNKDLGIDLGNDGVTANDAGDTDTGPDNLQNFPVLASACVVNGTGGALSRGTVLGSLNSTPNSQFIIDFFDSAKADSSGHGQGQTFVGNTIVTTDANGNANFQTSITGATIAHTISATATDANNNTSEFSQNVLAVQGVLLSGQVATSGATGIAGVRVALSGAASLGPVFTDSNGNYLFSGVKSGTYTVNLSGGPGGFIYSPNPGSVHIVNNNSTLNFTAIPLFNVSGTVTLAGTSTPLPNVVVTLTGGVTPLNASADANGNYTFANIVSGTYSVSGALAGFQINPNPASVTVNNANATQNLSASKLYGISGLIRGGSPAVGIQGVQVFLSGNANLTATTDATGKYAFTGPTGLGILLPGTYTLFPSSTTFSFTPVSGNVTITNSNGSVNFNATPIFKLTGTVTLPDGLTPVANVAVTRTGAGGSVTTTTNSAGLYTIPGLVNGTYSVSAALSGYSLSPNPASVTIANAAATQNFTATPLSISGTVTQPDGVTPLKGAAITLTGNGFNLSATTGTTGQYSFSLLTPGTYTLGATATGFVCSPNPATVTLGSVPATQNFTTVKTFSITGFVKQSNGTALQGVTATLGGAVAVPVTTDATGKFVFSNLLPGTYQVTLSGGPSGETYTPNPFTVNITTGSVSKNFVATP